MPLNPIAATPSAPLLGFVGAKGGAGATLLSTSLAWSLSRLGLRVVLLDFDIDSGVTALHLCDQNSGPTLFDVLLSIDRLDATLLDTLLTPAAAGLVLLPAPRQSQLDSGKLDGVTAEQLLTICRHAQQMADVVLLDLPSSPRSPALGRTLLSQLHRLHLITPPTLQALYCAQRRIDRMAGIGPTLEVVLNPIGRDDALTPSAIRKALELPQGPPEPRQLPRSDRTVAQALYEGQALAACSERDPLARCITQWAAEVATECRVRNPDPHQESAMRAAGSASGRAWLRSPFRRWSA